jgi:hypothetical protein
MPRSVRVAVGLTSVLLAAWTCAACGSSSHPSGVNGGSAASAGTSASTGTGPGNGTGGSDGINTGMNGSAANGGANGGGAPLDACAAHVSTAQPIPLDMYIMLDTSSSMLDVTTGTVTKWDAVKTAITSFLNDGASAGLGVGLQYFPLPKTPPAPTSCASDADCGTSGPCYFPKLCYGAPGTQAVLCNTEADCVVGNQDEGPCLLLAQCSNDASYICPNPGKACTASGTTENLGKCTAVAGQCEQTSSCDVSLYTTPATAIAALPGAATGLLASINGKTPYGDTPTQPALAGAIAQASAWASAHPDHRVVVLMATDGLPTDCIPPTAMSLADAVGDVAAIAAGGVKATPSINTFVIGVFNQDDVANGAPTNLNEIAVSGGTSKAFIVDTTQNVTTQFLSALDAIRGAHLACDFQIPQPTDGETLNFHQVNVNVTTASGTNQLFYVTKAELCDPTLGGWYYNVDPDTGATPTQIIACPTSCTAYQAATGTSSVGIALGCMTVVK